MVKNAAQLVAAFLLLSEVIKIESNVINARNMDYYILGETITIYLRSNLFGLKSGCTNARFIEP
jgi:hypothetical protein